MPAKDGVVGTLYTYPNNPRSDLIQISAQYGGSEVKLASGFEFGVTNVESGFVSKFPFGKVPAFECTEGSLFDTMSIASYVGGSALRGCDEFSRAQITQWANVAELELFPSACQVLYPCWGLMPNNKNIVNKGTENLKKFMSALDTHLEPRTYLVGESVTLADLALAMYLRDLYAMIFDESRRTSYGNVTRWFTTIMNQEEVIRIVGASVLCDKPAQFDPKLFTQNNPKQKKEPQQKKPAPKKKEEPKKEDSDEEEESPKPAPTKKLFEGLSKPALDMDAFKRLYWNQPTEEITKYFDENFKDGEWSIWKTIYKHSDELTVPYKTNNLVKGMMQRLETMKRFAFGLMYIFGTDNDMTIAGVWLTRGGNNIFLEDENWGVDIKQYDVTRLSMDNPEDKKLFFNFVAGTIEDWEGKPFYKDHIF